MNSNKKPIPYTWLNSPNPELREILMRICEGRKDMPLEFIEQGLNDEIYAVRSEAAYACVGRDDIPEDTIRQWLKSENTFYPDAAMCACRKRMDISLDTLEKGLRSTAAYLAAEAFTGRSDISADTIIRWLSGDDYWHRLAALYASMWRKDIPLELLEQGLTDENYDIADASARAFRGRTTDIPLETIEKLIGGSNQRGKLSNVRKEQAAMYACVGNTDIPTDVLKRWYSSDDWLLKTMAVNACVYREGMSWKDIEPAMTITGSSLYDNVRRSARCVCRENHIAVPVVRTFTPPDRVYKCCYNDVIVVAEIPKDAQVRGSLYHKCRADKAIITDIIGNVEGVKVGISWYDRKTTYYVGDEVHIDNFDFSDAENASGFHFYLNIDVEDLLL